MFGRGADDDGGDDSDVGDVDELMVVTMVKYYDCDGDDDYDDDDDDDADADGYCNDAAAEVCSCTHYYSYLSGPGGCV